MAMIEDPPASAANERGDCWVAVAGGSPPVAPDEQRGGVDVTFSSLTYTVKKSSIIRELSGSFHANRLCALMGPSGCGKTTLMDIFWAVALQGHYLVFVMGFFLTTICSIVFAYAFAAIAPNMEAGNAMLPTYVTTVAFFGGLFVLYDEIPSGWVWYSWTSFIRYGWAILMLNQFQDTESGKVIITAEGKTILEIFGMGPEQGVMGNLGSVTALICGIIVIMAIVGAASLTFLSFVKR